MYILCIFQGMQRGSRSPLGRLGPPPPCSSGPPSPPTSKVPPESQVPPPPPSPPILEVPPKKSLCGETMISNVLYIIIKLL